MATVDHKSVEDNDYDFEIMGLHRISDLEKIEPSRRKRLISIVSILLVVVGMAFLTTSTKSNQESIISSASQMKALRSQVSSLVTIRSHEAGNNLSFLEWFIIPEDFFICFLILYIYSMRLFCF